MFSPVVEAGEESEVRREVGRSGAEGASLRRGGGPKDRSWEDLWREREPCGGGD